MQATTYYQRNVKDNALGSLHVYAYHPTARGLMISHFSFADRADAMNLAQSVSKDTLGRVDVYHFQKLVRRYIRGRRERKL